jgi:hypothetical protein
MDPCDYNDIRHPVSGFEPVCQRRNRGSDRSAGRSLRVSPLPFEASMSGARDCIPNEARRVEERTSVTEEITFAWSYWRRDPWHRGI